MLSFSLADAARIQAFSYFQSYATANTQVVMPDVPRGVTRIIVAADLTHDDGVAHRIFFRALNPENFAVGLPGSNDGVALGASERNALLGPIILPELHHLVGECVVAPAAGKSLFLSVLYADIIR